MKDTHRERPQRRTTSMADHGFNPPPKTRNMPMPKVNKKGKRS